MLHSNCAGRVFWLGSLLGHPDTPHLIGGFCMRKRMVVSTIATVHASKPLESFLFGFSYPGGLGGRLLLRLCTVLPESQGPHAL